jgi:Ni,Fe-hydrogenase maturation factor
MRDLLSSDTVVVGVGNTILSDDGAAGVTILDGGTLGLELMPYISDASRVPRADGVFTSWELPI